MKIFGLNLNMRVNFLLFAFKIIIFFFFIDLFRENSPDLTNSWAIAAIFLFAALLSVYKNMYLDVNIYKKRNYYFI